jgi:hypothetical protein
MSDPQTKLGQLIVEEDAMRDAVHIAVAPVVARELMMPGTRIGLYEGEATALSDNLIGIVDPFLTKAVQRGQRFWMFLYPNTITSLKHVWTHPAFQEEAAVKNSKESSEAWLRNFCETADCPGYEATIAAAIGDGDRQWDSEHLHFSGRDAHGEIPPEFWDHVEVVTGKKITKRATYFSCSC